MGEWTTSQLTKPSSKNWREQRFLHGHEMVLIAKHDGKMMESELTSC